jgi:hypothetical protein
LLGRLFQALGRRATQIYLLPFQAPERAWQSILLTTIQELDRPSQHEPGEYTQLDAFAMGVLAHIAADFMVTGGVKDHDRLQQEIDYLRNHPLSIFGRDRQNSVLIDWLKARIGARADVTKLADLLKSRYINLDGRERAWLQVLAVYAFSEKGGVERHAALTWMRGEPLDNDEASALGLSPSENDGEAEASASEINQLSLRRLRSLCALSSYYRPFLFCFDQTEVYGSEKALAEALGNCIWRLHAELPNQLTIVTTNATNWTADIRPHIKPADQNRFSGEIRLEGINREQSQTLLVKRLQDFQLDDKRIARFSEVAWLDAQFKTQPFMGVRQLLNRAAIRFGELDGVREPKETQPIEEAFATEINKVRAKPALHQYNQDYLMWFTQVLIKGFDGVTVSKPQYRYFSTEWARQGQSVHFAFEGGEHNRRWAAIARQAERLAVGANDRAVVFRTPDLKPIPGPRWTAAREAIDQVKRLRIERLSLDDVCELHAAREFYSNALQGNVDFAPDEVLAWLKTHFRPWFEKYLSLDPANSASTANGTSSRSHPRKPSRRPQPASDGSEQDGRDPPLADLTEEQLNRAVDHMKTRLLADINEVLKTIGAESPSLKDALLAEVEKHPHLRAHPGPQTIYLQWRIA